MFEQKFLILKFNSVKSHIRKNFWVGIFFVCFCFFEDEAVILHDPIGFFKKNISLTNHK